MRSWPPSLALVVVAFAGLAACSTPKASSDGGAGTDGPEMPRPGQPGPPGCGLGAAAFCDTFDAPSAGGGREGELDPKKWSVLRTKQAALGGDSTTLGDNAIPI